MSFLIVPKTNMNDLIARIDEYLGKGGLFNPELMDHKQVSNLLQDCKDTLSNIKESND